MKKRSIITVLVIFGGLFLTLLLFTSVMMSALGPEKFGDAQNRIGVIEVEGPIMDSKKTLEDIKRFAEDDTIRGVVVRVNSPGGAVAPSQEIYSAVKRIKSVKPVVVSMGSTAASGGYYIACGADTIFASPGTVTGSIGVITQLFNVSGILEAIDVDVHTVKTGKYKDSGSPFRQFDFEDEEYFSQLVHDIHAQFIEDVAECREMSFDAVREVADGRVFTGRQAKELNLVDELGGFEEAIDFIAKKAGVEGKPTIVYPPKEGMGFLSEIFQAGVNSTIDEVKAQGIPKLQYMYVGPQ